MPQGTGFQPLEGERRTTLVFLSPSPFEGRLNGVQAPRRGLDKRRRGDGAGGGPRVGNPWLENSRPSWGGRKGTGRGRCRLPAWFTSPTHRVGTVLRPR